MFAHRGSVLSAKRAYMQQKRFIRFVILTILFLIHTAFLAMIVKENYEARELYVMATIFVILLLTGLNYIRLNLHHPLDIRIEFLVMICVPVGAVSCYVLNVDLGMGSVLAAGIVGTVSSFLPIMHQKSVWLKKMPTALYCGAFVGMSSAEVAPSLSFVLYAGVLTGLLFMLTKSFFVGVGGKLGTIAFGGVAIISSMYWLIK